MWIHTVGSNVKIPVDHALGTRAGREGGVLPLFGGKDVYKKPWLPGVGPKPKPLAGVLSVFFGGGQVLTKETGAFANQPPPPFPSTEVGAKIDGVAGISIARSPGHCVLGAK